MPVQCTDLLIYGRCHDMLYNPPGAWRGERMYGRCLNFLKVSLDMLMLGGICSELHMYIKDDTAQHVCTEL